MKRNIIYTLMLTLLTLMPAGLQAQSVTGMQYWFDDGSKHTISISEGGTTKSISTDGLSVGMHTLYYRFIQSGGDVIWEDDITDVETGEVTHERRYYTDLEYSPVYSSRFFKHEPSEGSTVEYWFDKKTHATTSLSGAEGETVTLDLTDISKFPGVPPTEYALLDTRQESQCHLYCRCDEVLGRLALSAVLGR